MFDDFGFFHVSPLCLPHQQFNIPFFIPFITARQSALQKLNNFIHNQQNSFTSIVYITRETPENTPPGKMQPDKGEKPAND
jgi:hypothetical protein